MSQEHAKVSVATGDVEKRLKALEERLEAVQEQLERFAKTLKGNGEAGLLGQVFLNSERLAMLHGQWRWVVGILAALSIAVVQALLKR